MRRDSRATPHRGRRVNHEPRDQATNPNHNVTVRRLVLTTRALNAGEYGFREAGTGLSANHTTAPTTNKRKREPELTRFFEFETLRV